MKEVFKRVVKYSNMKHLYPLFECEFSDVDDYTDKCLNMAFKDFENALTEVIDQQAIKRLIPLVNAYITKTSDVSKAYGMRAMNEVFEDMNNDESKTFLQEIAINDKNHNEKDDLAFEKLLENLRVYLDENAIDNIVSFLLDYSQLIEENNFISGMKFYSQLNKSLERI